MLKEDRDLYPDDDFALIALESARLAASRLNEDTLAEFAQQVAKTLEITGHHPSIEEWLRLIKVGPEAVREAMLDLSEHGRYMRSLIPFRAFVSPVERRDIIRSVERLARESSFEGA